MDNLMELLKTRRTYRRFEQKEIAQEIIDEIQRQIDEFIQNK